MENRRIVIDTNVIFAALLSRHSRVRGHLIRASGNSFYSPRFVMVELFKHKERICRATELPEDELLDILNALLNRLHFIEDGLVPIGAWMEARRLCGEIDVKDTPFVAHSLHLNALLWTQDSELVDGLRRKGFERLYQPPI